MTAKSLIAANWKMNKDTKEAVSFINDFKKYVKDVKNTDIVIKAYEVEGVKTYDVIQNCTFLSKGVKTN